MPAVDYDYNYYNNARKVNRTANTKRATNKVGSSVAMTSNKKQNYTSTRQSTKDQVRQVMYESAKKQSARKTTKKNNDLDIPSINNSKKSKTTKPVEMKLKKPELSPAQKKKAKEKVINRVKDVMTLLIGFAIAFLICYRYSLIDQRFNQLEKTKKELSTAQTVNEQIQADIDSQTDLSYIENYAKYQLGMQKPSNSQIVYVNVEKEDRILTPVTIEEDSNKTWLDQLYEEIVKLFE